MTRSLTVRTRNMLGRVPRLIAFSSVIAIASTVTLSSILEAQSFGKVVMDPGAYARFAKQLTELKRQFDQMKAMKDSLNGISNVKDLASLLNDREFQQYLPQEYSKYSGSVNSLIQGNVDDLAQKYDYYSREGSTSANDYYNQELKRQKGETYQDMAVGEAVYNQASKRVDGLNELRDKLADAKTPKEVLDLQARVSVESAFLQNDINRMQGLSMIQEARTRIDKQRNIEQKNKMIDELHDYVNGK